MGIFAKDMPLWLITLLEGFDYTKFVPVNYQKLLVSIGHYIKTKNLLRNDDIIPVEKKTNIPGDLLNLLNFIDFTIINEGTPAREFRQDIYNFIKKYSEV